MENWKEIFASFGLWSLVDDISDDGDGQGDNLQLTKDGELFVSEIQQELDKAREEGIREGLEDILSEVENWKTHYLDTTKSEPSKTMQIGLVNVIRKMLSKLTTK